ncbi:unnamed protein product [Lactuca virosa]|uniref:MOM1 alpha-helical domain-containing protein n=1 Tax=Lactuca virosa TaxID=75947 RepID=A0AAU9NV67_9ASTR|nr:unnamed protein product [Lactuca virosa]
MAKEDGNTKSKRKDASSASLSGSADASGLRKSGRETPSKKQATASPLSNARRSERIENHATPSSSPIKKKQDKIEEQMGPSPLRRSDRSKKQVSPDSSGSKKLTEDPDVGGRKRKRMTVRGYKALFKPQRLRIEAEDGQDSDVQHTPAESGRTTESGNGGKQVGGKCSQDNNGKMSTQYIDVDACEDSDNQISPKSPSSGCKKHGDDETSLACSKEQRINNDSKNQQELESHDKTCDKDLQGTSTSKVRKTCQEAGVMEDTENNNAKFVEFWVPVQISNLQLEQYCSTLLSDAMALRSGSKSDSVEALHNILKSNRKCCNHPYTADKDLQKSITKDQPTMIYDIGLKASGKLHFLDLILPEVKKRQLRVVILFQPIVPERVTTESNTPPVTLGDILDDFVHQRFGEDSYERVDGARMAQKSKQAAFNSFNNNPNKFIFLLERSNQPSIKLSSVDIVIIFDSDLNPANDIRKLSIDSDSQQKQIMIFRLYSKNTLEEKILKLAQQNVAVDSKRSRLTCDALLMWGAKDLFKNLEKFHGESGKDISSQGNLLKDVMEEFLYIISNKGKNKDGEKSMITKVQTCGYYGNRNMPYGDIKNQLPDGEQPHIFWRNLLEGKYPQWKFVHVSTSRQRKRTQYYGETSDTIAPVADAVKKRKKSPASRPVEWGTGGAYEGGNNESQSSPELLHPTVHELCKILKFPEDVKNKVDGFLDFVLKNYNVSREDTTTLQAFMISLCWIGASLAKHKIDRKESFDLAKKQLNFDCKEEQVNSVHLKLEEAKEDFLNQTETQEKHVEIKDLKSPPQAICTESKSTDQKTSTESQQNQNVEVSVAENLESTEKLSEEMEEFNREWNDRRACLENEYKVEKAIIRTVHKNPSKRTEKLRLLDKEFAKKIEEHERDKDIHLKELKSTLLAADVDADVAAKPETSVSVGNPGDKMTEAPLELDGGRVQDQSKERGSLGIGDDIESTGSHTSEKQMVDATVLSSSVVEAEVEVEVEVEVPPCQHETVDDVAGVVNEEIPAQEGDGIGNDVELVEADLNQEKNSNGDGNGAEVADRVDDTGETGVPGGDEIREHEEDRTQKHDESHAVEDQEQNDSCGSSSSNQLSAGVPHDDTPSVQLVASQPPDPPMPTILETENESLLEQLLDLGIQEKEAQGDPNSSAQINSEEQPHDDPMAENQTDTQPANETTCENDVNAPDTVNDQQTGQQEQVQVSTQNSNPPEITNQNTSQPIINLFDLPNQVAPRIPNQGDPLQAELERLFAHRDNVTKFYEETKQRMKSECDKEIADMIAQITLKYEAKFKGAEEAFQLRKKELNITVNRVVMNRILAEAFRAKCQDINHSGLGMPKVSQAGLMQQLHRFSVRPSVGVVSSSPGQSSGRQQTPPPPPPPPPPSSLPPPPPPPPPLQIVHQPAALFSNTVIRPPPPTINPVTPVSRPPPNINPNTRPPPTITPVTPTTATRPPPNITPITPSAGSLRGSAPHLRPLVNSDIRSPAPHIRPLVNSDIRAPAPHLRPYKPSTSASPELTPYRRMVPVPVPDQHVTTPPNTRPPLPPLPPEASYVPPPPPPSGGGAQYNLVDLTDIFPEDNEKPPPPPPPPSGGVGHDLVCLSDDD